MLRFLVVNFSCKGIRLRRGPAVSFLVIDFRHTGHVPLFLFESELEFLASAVARHSRIQRWQNRWPIHRKGQYKTEGHIGSAMFKAFPAGSSINIPQAVLVASSGVSMQIGHLYDPSTERALFASSPCGCWDLTASSLRLESVLASSEELSTSVRSIA